jgi:hypothetical protein
VPPGTAERTAAFRLHGSGALTLVAYATGAAISHTATPRARPGVILAALATATLGSLGALACSRAPDRRASRLALSYGLVFGLLAALAIPVFGYDFWYYLAEARLAARGGNVYTTLLTADDMAGLAVPYHSVNATMAYGPAWVWISAAAALLTDRSLAREFLAFKAVHFLAWLVALLMIRHVWRAAPPAQFKATVLFAWLPFALMAAVSEAHNDIVMMALVTIWLGSQAPASILALALSALVKFVSLPIAGFAAVEALRQRSRVALVIAVAGLAIIAGVLLFYWQDGAVVAGLSRNKGMRLYTPVALLDLAVSARGLPAWIAVAGTLAWRLLLLAGMVWYGWLWFRRPTPPRRAAFVTMAFLGAALGTGYMHPHYFLWVLPCFLMVADARLAFIVVPYVTVLPLMQVLRIAGVTSEFRLTLALHAALVVCCTLYVVFRKPATRLLSFALPDGALHNPEST